MTTNSPKGKILARALVLFAPIHENEALTAFLMMLSTFVLLTTYYIIKPVRGALVLGGSDAEIKTCAEAPPGGLGVPLGVAFFSLGAIFGAQVAAWLVKPLGPRCAVRLALAAAIVRMRKHQYITEPELRLAA